MAYLLDTNALSEVSKPEPNKGFIGWFKQVEESDLYVSCITIGELYKGIELLPNTKKRTSLEKHTAEIIKAFNDRILKIDLNTTLIWSKLIANSIKKGQTAPSIDSLIASQSIQNNLVLVTRNIKDFEQFTELTTLCPWDS
jgi:predicted nucleic acid-binding protein